MVFDAREFRCCQVDGSVLGTPSRGGYGGCLRSFEGGWLRGFFGFQPTSDILFLELLAIFHGLTMAWELGYRIVECQSDSLHAVSLVLAPPVARHLYASLLWDIKDLLERSWRVKLVLTLREGNMCADLLAKHGANQDEELVFIENPWQGLGSLLLAYELGVSFLRP